MTLGFSCALGCEADIEALAEAWPKKLPANVAALDWQDLDTLLPPDLVLLYSEKASGAQTLRGLIGVAAGSLMGNFGVARIQPALRDRLAKMDDDALRQARLRLETMRGEVELLGAQRQLAFWRALGPRRLPWWELRDRWDRGAVALAGGGGVAAVAAPPGATPWWALLLAAIAGTLLAWLYLAWKQRRDRIENLEAHLDGLRGRKRDGGASPRRIAQLRALRALCAQASEEKPVILCWKL